MESLGAREERRSFRGALEWGLRIVVLLMIGAAAEGQVAREYEVKAAHLLSFAKFTEWPSGAFADSEAPMAIGILGDDPFGAMLDDTVRNEVVRGHRLQVKRF